MENHNLPIIDLHLGQKRMKNENLPVISLSIKEMIDQNR